MGDEELVNGSYPILTSHSHLHCEVHTKWILHSKKEYLQFLHLNFR